MLPGRGRLWALVCLLLACAQLATAAHVHPLWQRAAATDTAVAASSTTTASTTKHTAASATATTTKADTTQAHNSDDDDSSSSSSSSVTVAVTSASVAATPTMNTTMFNITSIPAGQLPLQPALTPGWGVAGVLLLGTGVAYGLVGVRHQALQTFFSAAYLGALGTTVLILYVLAPPVRPAVQGAYVVAAVGTGAALGGLAVVFRDLAEGLGCLLGGFCLGMWLLCLRARGLLHHGTAAVDEGEGLAAGTAVDGTGTTVFLVAFAVGVYALSWTRWTRPHALVGSIALGGATAAVLGIDAFSRAGLKEFWVYVWHLNGGDGSGSGSGSSRNSLFPLATTTYPLTRGLRVELAATVLLAAAGVVSQLRLWRVVQARRARRDAARADEEAQRQRAAAVMDTVREAQTARARVAWAAVYDERRARGAIPLPEPPFPHGVRPPRPPVSPADSGVGSDVGSEKSAKRRTGTVATDKTDAIEMDDLQEKDPALRRDGPAITVRVVAEDDDVEDSSPAATPSPAAGGPRIVPLPFAVPALGDDDADKDADNDADRSSRAATVADEEDVGAALDAVDGPATPSRASFAKRLSHGSAGLLRSLSQRSRKRASGAAAATDARGESQEALVSPRGSRALNGVVDGTADDAADDDETDSAAGHGPSESVAATMDGMSSEEEEEEEKEETAAAETEAATEKENEEAEPPAAPPAPLTRDRLPRSLSRVALSYRTNEWAKHLSQADTPAPDAPLAVPSGPTGGAEAGVTGADEGGEAAADTGTNEDSSSSSRTETAAVDDGETPAPVDVAALQQTAATGAPPPVVVRRSVSMATVVAAGGRPGSVLRPSASAPRLSTASLGAGGHGPGHGNGLRHEPIAEEPDADTAGGNGNGSSGGSEHGRTVPPPVAGVASCTAPQSLLGQRDVLLRRSLSQQVLAGFLVSPPPPRPRMVHSASLASLTRPASPTVPAAVFNSHQPQRDNSHLPSAAAREARLATFRSSVAADLRASASASSLALSSPAVPRVGSPIYYAGGHSHSRESFAAAAAGPGTATHPYLVARAASSASLAALPGPPLPDELDARRSTLLGQREAEAQRRARQRLDQARVDRAFEERIRQGGDLLEAHREALRRMQAGAGR